MNANWEATHRADPGAAPGAGYDRDPALGVGVDRYFGVLHDNGIVDGYTERLPKGVSIGEALQAALDEVPAGTKVLWFVTKPTCAQEELRSSILASSGIDGVFVEFATATAAGDQGYSPKNANEVIFKLGSYPKVADAPGC